MCGQTRQQKKEEEKNNNNKSAENRTEENATIADIHMDQLGEVVGYQSVNDLPAASEVSRSFRLLAESAIDDWINEYFYLNPTQAEHNASRALLDQIQSGEDGDVLARQDNESITRGSLGTLDPGAWLNDEIIAFYLKHCLANRDERKCLHESRERRQAFFSSYFFDHLYENLDNNRRRRRRYN